MAAPFFLAALDLSGRACVVFGGGDEAERRVRELSEHGAVLTLVTPAPGPALTALALSSDTLVLHEREPALTDLDGVFLAVLADRNPAWVAMFGPAARARQLLFCAIDQPEFNSFAHVGVARAGVLQLGVSTSGRVPGVAGAIRKLLQTLLDDSRFERIVEKVQEVRESAPVSARSARVRALAAKIRLEGRLLLDDED